MMIYKHIHKGSSSSSWHAVAAHTLSRISARIRPTKPLLDDDRLFPCAYFARRLVYVVEAEHVLDAPLVFKELVVWV